MSDITTLMMAAAGAGGETDENFNQTVLLLHGDGTNGAQNNTFLDSSTNNFTITRNGNTTQGTFSPFSAPDGRWSNYFDGTGDYLLTDTGSVSVGTGDFLMECWVYPLDSGGDIIFDTRGGSNTNKPTLGRVSDLLTYQTSGANRINAGSVPIGSWTHCRFIRNSGVVYGYVNGVNVGSTYSDSSDYGTISRFMLGADDDGTPNAYFNGYIASARFVLGTFSTSDFDVPTAPPTSDANTSLLTCQSNRFVDNSTNNFAITRNGDVKVTPFSPFAPTAAYSPSVNGGSGYFDGTGDYLSIADAAGLRFGTGNFTIQCWIYRNAAGAVHSIAAKGGASTGWVFQVHSDNKLRFTHTTTNIDSTGTIPASAWTHVAVVREGTGTNQVKLYINGVNDGQGTVNTDFNQTEQLNIGADRGNSNVMNGYIAGWKYVVGTAETITVPTAPPTGGTALLNFTNAGIFDNTGKNNLETVGNAQIDTTTKKYGTGSMEFDGTGDYLASVSKPDLYLGSGNFTVELWVYPNSNSISSFVAQGAIDSDGWALGYSNTTGKLWWYSNSGAVILSTSTLPTGSWAHIAVVRSGSTLTMYVNGSSQGTATNTTNYAGTTVFYIGSDEFGQSFNGFIDDLRITKGVARYTSNFTPPDAPFLDQ